jgi:hypothetical protein
LLFSNNLQVKAYGERVAKQCIDAGMDVFLHTDVSETASAIAALGPPFAAVSGTGPVKPGDLAGAIAASFADYLIVIGDRNMANNSCQARRSGKLVEMPIDERIKTIVAAWHAAEAAQSGLDAVGAGKDTDKVIAAMSQDQLLARLSRHAGVTHLADRISRLKQTVSEISEIRNRTARNTALVSSSSGGSSGAQSFSADMIDRLTRAQIALIKLHKDVIDAGLVLKRTSILSQSSSAASAPQRRAAGEHRGPYYRPPSSSAAAAAASLPQTVPSLPAKLHERLTKLVAELLVQLEGEYGAQIVEASGGTCALWTAHMTVGVLRGRISVHHRLSSRLLLDAYVCFRVIVLDFAGISCCIQAGRLRWQPQCRGRRRHFSSSERGRQARQEGRSRCSKVISG